MTRKFFGNPESGKQKENFNSVDEKLREIAEIAADVEQIKVKDPKGWAAAELSAAKELILDHLAKRDENMVEIPSQSLSDYNKRYSANEHLVRNLTRLEDVHTVAEKKGLAFESENFEVLVWEIYNNK